MANKASDTFTLKNDNGVEITFTAEGGRLVSVKVPSKNNGVADVIIGYDTVAEALKGDQYFGAICGRYANRIANGEFELDGKKYKLDTNDAPNHLHGGNEGFNKRVWSVEPTVKNGAVSAFKLTLTSPDGDQKYPGELKISVIYSLSADNSFCIEYEAETDKPTVVGLTCHPYFNLKGAGTGDATEQELQLMASKYTTIDPKQMTCMGEIADVKGTPMDFTLPKKVKLALVDKHPQIRLVDGIDHNFVIDGGGKGVKLAARFHDPETNRTMEVYTDQPGIQIYTGNHFDGSDKGKLGVGMVKYAGFAFETQIFPNSPNIDKFPNAILRPGETYKHTCIYKFCW